MLRRAGFCGEGRPFLPMTDTTRRSEPRETNRRHEYRADRSGGTGHGAMRGGEQRAMAGEEGVTAEPGRQSKHAMERHFKGPHRPEVPRPDDE